MRPFTYERAEDIAWAMRAAGDANSAFLAGGTTLLDLMKLDVLRPKALINVSGPAEPGSAVTAGPDGLRLSAFAPMAEIAEHDTVRKLEGMATAVDSGAV